MGQGLETCVESRRAQRRAGSPGTSRELGVGLAAPGHPVPMPMGWSWGGFGRCSITLSKAESWHPGAGGPKGFSAGASSCSSPSLGFWR